MLAPALNYLMQRPMLDIVFREMTGNNLPHVAMVRTQDEFVDQFICQFGNTAAIFGSGWLLGKGIEKLSRHVLSAEEMGRPLFQLGTSLGVYAWIVPVMLAMPFLRNFVTTKRSGTLNYAEMIGETEKRRYHTESLEQTQNTYWQRFTKTLGIGAALSTSILALTVLLARTGKTLPEQLKRLHHYIGLPQGNFENFGSSVKRVFLLGHDLPAVLFWVLPTYGGLMAGARDRYELKELALRFAAFNFAFFVFPRTIQKAVATWAHHRPPTQLFGAPENLAYVAKLLSSLLFCSAVPTVLNIALTRWRVQRDRQNTLAPGLPQHSGFQKRPVPWPSAYRPQPVLLPVQSTDSQKGSGDR